MLIRKLIILLLVCTAFQEGSSQDPKTHIYSESPLLELGFLADVMYNGAADEHRVWAARQFEHALKGYIKMNYIQSLDSMPWFQLKCPADSSFALITWQYQDNNGVFNPRGLIAYKNGQLTELRYNGDSWTDAYYQSFSSDEWPGAVYYNMLPFENAESDTLWLLFGYHGWDSKTRLRVLDVLDLRTGQVQFGAPVFVIKDDPVRPDRQYRKVLKYTSQANVRIVPDDSLGMILMDHLIPATTPEGQLTFVPDGSYEAFEFKDGYWYFVEKVFDQTQDVPPGTPRTEPEKRDIFGRKL